MNPRKGMPRAAVGRSAPLLLLALLVAVGMSVTANAGATRSQPGKERSSTDLARPLIGTWRLTSWVIRDQDGNVGSAFKDPVGKITYTQRGDVWSVFGERHGPSGSDPRNWYTGTFDVHPRAHEVVHHVRFSSIHGYQGADLVRHYKRRGDRLVLSFPLGASTSYVHWVRAH